MWRLVFNVLWVSDDAFIYHNNMKFSTKDRDNDLSSSINCASYYGEPWWNNDCSRMMFTRNNFNDLGWYNWYTGSYKQLSKIRMMIRKPLIVETSGKFLRSHVLFLKKQGIWHFHFWMYLLKNKKNSYNLIPLICRYTSKRLVWRRVYIWCNFIHIHVFDLLYHLKRD